MAEEVQHFENKRDECGQAPFKVEEGAPVEATDRGLFDFPGKKEEEKKAQGQEPICTEFDEKVKVSEPEKKEGEMKHGGFLEKLHRSNSSSSSSSEEEAELEEGGEKKKKKKKEKKGDEKHGEDTTVPVEKYDEPSDSHADAGEEKKGFLDKVKEKIPGGHKKTEEVAPPAAAECAATPGQEGEANEKKGFLDKIKEKLPGYRPKTEDEKEKEKEKGTASS